MIKCNGKGIRISGTVIELAADFATIAFCIYDSMKDRFSKDEVSELLHRAVDDGLEVNKDGGAEDAD